MAKISKPLLFSKHFNVAEKHFETEGLIDPFLNVDTQLFIDPVLLDKSGFAEISKDGYKAFREHFGNYIRLLSISEKEGDAAWKGARSLLDLSEPPQTGLGYGGSGRSGSSRPNEVRETIMRTSKEIIELGSKDPEMISLMGFLEENVGPDTISDFTTRVIMGNLAKITEDFCMRHGVPVSNVNEYNGVKLPKYNRSPVILVPKDIVRDLPIANDWSDIEAAALQNQQIRSRVNALLGGIARPTVAERKTALRIAALGSSKDFESFLASVKDNASNYDPTVDALAYYKLRDILRGDLNQFKQPVKPDLSISPDALRDFVIETINHFKHHVEHGNLWEELWIGNQPKKERAAQLIYFAIADCFCIANNIDISPEANMGGGPIDFKFSKGYKARVLVELKRSTGSVVHGYKKQLEIYKNASRTNYGIFVVMDVGKMGNKLREIQRIQRRRLDNGEPASQIIVIDATRKASASKRK